MNHFERVNDLTFVQDLISRHLLQYRHEQLVRLASSGTDNALYRLGSKLLIRLPRNDFAAAQIVKEVAVVKQVQPIIPFRLPICVQLAAPTEDFPAYWSVWQWIDGVAPELVDCYDNSLLATNIIALLQALRGVKDESIPLYGPHNAFRGEPLINRDDRVRRALTNLTSKYDGAFALMIWQEALCAPMQSNDIVFIHGDLHPHNLLFADGRLSAVIDWGLAARGDVACDLMACWTLCASHHRLMIKQALHISDVEWARARGWALMFAVLILDFYGESNPYLYHLGDHVLRQLLAEHV